MLKPYFARNKLNMINRFTLLLLVSVMLTGCYSATKITGSWKNPEVEAKKMEKVLVLGLTENTLVREAFESAMTERFNNDGIRAVPSITEIGNAQIPDTGDKYKIAEKLKSKGYDGVLVLALLDVNTEERYVSTGGAGYNPYMYGAGGRYGYYGSFNAYYYNMAPVVYESGYYTETKQYILESNLYDLEDGALTWSAQTKTTDPSSKERFASDYAYAVYTKIKSDKAIVLPSATE